MNGQYGYGQGGFQYPQQTQQRRRTNWYNIQDGDNWIQLLSLQERQFQTRYGSQKYIRDVLVNGQKFTVSLPKTANQQLQQALQTIMATGKNPLEFTYNIRRNRVGVEPYDVVYQIVTGEWVGLQNIRAIQQNDLSQQRTQATSSTPLIFQQGQQQPQQMPFKQPEMPQKQAFPQRPINPFVQQRVPENVIVLTENEKTLLEMAEQGEKLEKGDFINKWVQAMRTQFNEPDYSIQRADIVYNQFYQNATI